MAEQSFVRGNNVEDEDVIVDNDDDDDGNGDNGCDGDDATGRDSMAESGIRDNHERDGGDNATISGVQVTKCSTLGVLLGPKGFENSSQRVQRTAAGNYTPRQDILSFAVRQARCGPSAMLENLTRRYLGRYSQPGEDKITTAISCLYQKQKTGRTLLPEGSGCRGAPCV